MSNPTRGETFVMEGAAAGERAPIEFTTFLLGLASNTLINLGDAPHPETGKSERNLALARESLELLAMLREKTRGNLSAEEEKVFANILSDLRLRYVEATRR